jgi:hypothetical protein
MHAGAWLQPKVFVCIGAGRIDLGGVYCNKPRSKIISRPQHAAAYTGAAAVRDVCRAAASRGLTRCLGQGRIRGEVVMPREAGYSPVFDCMTTSPAFLHAKNPVQNQPRSTGTALSVRQHTCFRRVIVLLINVVAATRRCVSVAVCSPFGGQSVLLNSS